MMMAGTTKNVTNSQAAPAMLLTMLPRNPERSRMACKMSPTVAVAIAHGTSPPMWRDALLTELDTVGSPPVMRS